MQDDIIRKIIEIEWKMFSEVSNIGGTASCQENPKAFRIMRKSQFVSWSIDVLKSYLKDFKSCKAGWQKPYDREICQNDQHREARSGRQPLFSKKHTMTVPYPEPKQSGRRVPRWLAIVAAVAVVGLLIVLLALLLRSVGPPA